MLNGCNLLPGAEFYVAIDNKGLWPNLTLLPNGEVAAVVYNHPSHGLGSGSNVELWVSRDGGRMWEFRNTVSDLGDEPTAIRMNHAAGLNARGEMVVLVSGYHEGQKRPLLPVQCCVSSDHGATWTRHLLDNARVPFGDILCLPDGRLCCPMYKMISREPRVSDSSVYFSTDQGRTWDSSAYIGDASETHLIRCSNGDWLAAARTGCRDRMDDALPHGSGEALFRSSDEGQTWSEGKPLSPQGQENAHMLELRDGRILCSFTSRIPGLFGVVMRLSEDSGDTWSAPCVLMSVPARDWHKTDIGYPSCVQLADGTIVTAYYAGPKRQEWAGHGLPWHQRYHMGVARWDMSCWPEQ